MLKNGTSDNRKFHGRDQEPRSSKRIANAKKKTTKSTEVSTTITGCTVCRVCQVKNTKELTRMLVCCGCNQCFHPKCVGLEALSDHTRTSVALFQALDEKWSCHECLISIMELARAPGDKSVPPTTEPPTTEPPQATVNPLTASENPGNRKPTGEKDYTLSVSDELGPVESRTQGHPCQNCSCGKTTQPSTELIRQIVAIVKAELLNEKVKPLEVIQIATDQAKTTDQDKAQTNSENMDPVIEPTLAEIVTEATKDSSEGWTRVEKRVPPKKPLPKIILRSDDTVKTAEKIKEVLVDTPVYRSSVRAGRVTLEFKTPDIHEDAHNLLKKNMDSTTKIQTAEMGKVSILNVPIEQGISDKEAREDIYEGLKRKNEILRDTEFSVIYFKRHRRNQELATIGLRVTAEIRDLLLEKGAVNYDLGRYRVEKRVYYRQCFHCQAPGHIASECQENKPCCMFCSGDHKTTDCLTKDDRNTHRCANCKQGTHHAGYQGCPALLKYVEDQSKNYHRT